MSVLSPHQSRPRRKESKGWSSYKKIQSFMFTNYTVPSYCPGPVLFSGWRFRTIFSVLLAGGGQAEYCNAMPSVVIRGDQPAGESVFIADIILQIYWVTTSLPTLGWAHGHYRTVLYSCKGSPLSPTFRLNSNISSYISPTDRTGWRNP